MKRNYCQQFCTNFRRWYKTHLPAKQWLKSEYVHFDERRRRPTISIDFYELFDRYMETPYSGVMEKTNFTLFDIKNVLELTHEHLIQRGAREGFAAEVNRQLVTFQSPYRLCGGKFIRPKVEIQNVVSFSPIKIGEWDLFREFEPAMYLGDDFVIEKERRKKKKTAGSGATPSARTAAFRPVTPAKTDSPFIITPPTKKTPLLDVDALFAEADRNRVINLKGENLKKTAPAAQPSPALTEQKTAKPGAAFLFGDTGNLVPNFEKPNPKKKAERPQSGKRKAKPKPIAPDEAIMADFVLDTANEHAEYLSGNNLTPLTAEDDESLHPYFILSKDNDIQEKAAQLRAPKPKRKKPADVYINSSNAAGDTILEDMDYDLTGSEEFEYAVLTEEAYSDFVEEETLETAMLLETENADFADTELRDVIAAVDTEAEPRALLADEDDDFSGTDELTASLLDDTDLDFLDDGEFETLSLLDEDEITFNEDTASQTRSLLKEETVLLEPEITVLDEADLDFFGNEKPKTALLLEEDEPLAAELEIVVLTEADLNPRITGEPQAVPLFNEDMIVLTGDTAPETAALAADDAYAPNVVRTAFTKRRASRFPQPVKPTGHTSLSLDKTTYHDILALLDDEDANDFEKKALDLDDDFLLDDVEDIQESAALALSEDLTSPAVGVDMKIQTEAGLAGYDIDEEFFDEDELEGGSTFNNDDLNIMTLLDTNVSDSDELSLRFDDDEFLPDEK